MELMVALGLLALLLLAVGVASTGTSRDNQQSGLRLIRSQVVNELRQTLNNRKEIVASGKKPENQVGLE